MANCRLPLTIQIANLIALISLSTTPALAGAESLSPRDAGARYGQALGAIEVCHGSKLTAAAEALRSMYAGIGNQTPKAQFNVEFNAQAAKIFNAWRAVKNCANGRDPNQCKIIMDKSCADAEAEIGANGHVLPGLVDFAPR